MAETSTVVTIATAAVLTDKVVKSVVEVRNRLAEIRAVVIKDLLGLARSYFNRFYFGKLMPTINLNC